MPITGLTDGIVYTTAIAAVDALGNVGPASGVQCASPQPVSDFWDDYVADGGQARCSLSPRPTETAGLGALGLAGTAVMLGVRNRRRKANRPRSSRDA